MSNYNQINKPFSIARVKSITDDNRRLYLELQNGQMATVDSDNFLNFNVGSIVLVGSGELQNYIEVAPDDLWPVESWVGVVRLKLQDITIVDSGGQWKILKTNYAIDYKEGNTIEAKNSIGIIRVLSEKPLKYFDLPVIDDSVINNFKLSDHSLKETFEDFGGFANVVIRAHELIEISLKRKKELSEIGARPIKGVLFTGPPGTGKTMLAKIIANSIDAVFYEISGPEVFSKWYGQSEEIIRKLFEDAAKQEQAIIFFDEIDSVAGERDNDAHEVSRRVVAQLLALMDGFTSDTNVIIIAATNRPQDIDTALRRPGRFDWEIHFSLPDCQDRESILKVSSNRLKTKGILPHRLISQKTNGWSAADLTAIWSEASLLAIADGRSVILTEDYIGGFERVYAQRKRLST